MQFTAVLQGACYDCGRADQPVAVIAVAGSRVVAGLCQDCALHAGYLHAFIRVATVSWPTPEITFCLCAGANVPAFTKVFPFVDAPVSGEQETGAPALTPRAAPPSKRPVPYLTALPAIDPRRAGW